MTGRGLNMPVAGGFMDRYGYPFCRGRIFEHVEADAGQYDTPLPVFWASGAALMIRLDAYREAGGLDGRFFAHMEEIDLCWRLRSRGYLLFVCLLRWCIMWEAATLKKESPRKTYLNFRNNLLMLYKNLPEPELRHVMAVRKILDYVAALAFLLKGETSGFKAVLKARRDFRRMLPSFVADRKENIARSVTEDIPERFRFSILWQSKIKGKKDVRTAHRLIFRAEDTEREDDLADASPSVSVKVIFRKPSGRLWLLRHECRYLQSRQLPTALSFRSLL